MSLNQVTAEVNCAPAPSVVQTNLPVIGPTGQRVALMRLGTKEKIFLAISLFNLLATLGLAVHRLVSIAQNGKEATADFTFSVLIIVNAGFCMFYTLNGILREQIYQLYVLIVAIFVLFVYCVAEYIINQNGRSSIKVARLVAACVLAPVNICLTVLVIKDFGWLEFRIIGASEALQRMYREATRFFSLILLDLQVACSVAVLVLRDGTDTSLYEQVILGVGLPTCVFYVFWSWFTVTRELKPGIILFAVLGLLAPAYVMFEVFKVYKDGFQKHELKNNYILYTVLGACALALFVRCTVYVEFYKVYKNFGKGLRERVFINNNE